MKPIDIDVAPKITKRWWVCGHIVLWPWAWVLRLRRYGRHNIPKAGPVLIVCNHVGQKDPPLVGLAATPRQSYYMAKIELFSVYALRRIIHRMGAFPVVRGGADRRAMRIARELLERGEMLLMFPEGHRSRDGMMRPGLAGAGALGLMPGVTVVPAAIWGSQRAFGPVKVIFGPPLDLSDISEGPRGQRAQEAVDRMMAAIARLLPQIGGPSQDPPRRVVEERAA